LRGYEILEDGSRGQYRQRRQSLPNCNDNWQTLQACGEGYAASGVVAHFTERGGRAPEIVGLQLVCRRIVSGGD
jgi:hypothetical protein